MKVIFNIKLFYNKNQKCIQLTATQRFQPREVETKCQSQWTRKQQEPQRALWRCPGWTLSTLPHSCKSIWVRENLTQSFVLFDYFWISMSCSTLGFTKYQFRGQIFNVIFATSLTMTRQKNYKIKKSFKSISLSFKVIRFILHPATNAPEPSRQLVRLESTISGNQTSREYSK